MCQLSKLQSLKKEFHEDVTSLVAVSFQGDLLKAQLPVQMDGRFQACVAFKEDPPDTNLSRVVYQGGPEPVADMTPLRLRRNGHLG